MITTGFKGWAINWDYQNYVEGIKLHSSAKVQLSSHSDKTRKKIYKMYRTFQFPII
jgi:hypothetical protein